MTALFIAGWLICLDESMSKWINRYTCPGFVFCPQKPLPFSNEWHTIACSICTIIFFVELLEGKDRPKDAPPCEFSDMSKTVGLVLRMTRPIWHRAKCVILDSEFCVLWAIAELRNKGVYASAVVKKRRYWSKYVDGDAVKKYFLTKDVGASDAIVGTLHGVPFHLFCMKEENYVQTLMSTYGTMDEKSTAHRTCGKKSDQERKVLFPLTEVHHNHFKGRHSVDDNNSQ